jgi:hypothetical protein
MKHINFIIILLLLFLSNYTFSQNKKEQIKILENRIDSISKILDNERIIYSTKEENYNSKISTYEDLFFQFKSRIELNKVDSIKRLMLLENLINDIVKKNDTIRTLMVKSYLYIDLNNNGVNEFLNGLDINFSIKIPSSIIYKIKDENDSKILIFDFSKKDETFFEKYNISSFEVLKSKIKVNKKSEVEYIYWNKTCCPGDNEEVLILPFLNSYIVIEHFYGIYGGHIKVTHNKTTKTFEYEKSYQENDFFLDLN